MTMLCYYSTDDYLAVIVAVRGGAKVGEVLGKNGLPSKPQFYRAIRSKPALAAQYQEALAVRDRSPLQSIAQTEQ
jgi:hypothetical protein